MKYMFVYDILNFPLKKNYSFVYVFIYILFAKNVVFIVEGSQAWLIADSHRGVRGVEMW